MTNETTRDAPLAMDAPTFRQLGHRLVDQLADLLALVPGGPVTHGEAPSVVRAALGLSGPLPECGMEPGPLLEQTAGLLFEHSLLNAHPRFFGYITSSPAPIGILGDFLASAVNPNVGSFILSPAATEIESQTVRWIDVVASPCLSPSWGLSSKHLRIAAGEHESSECLANNVLGRPHDRAFECPWA